MTIQAFAALAAILIFPAAMIHAGITDLTTMKIRNRLVLVLVAAYAILAPLAGLGLQEIGISLAVAASVFAVAFAFFAFGWIGGGDAKLATATALWLGADHTLAYLVYTALFGGALALCLLQFRRAVIPASWHGRPWIARLYWGESGIPYGLAMAAGALVVFRDTPWIANFL